MTPRAAGGEGTDATSTQENDDEKKRKQTHIETAAAAVLTSMRVANERRDGRRGGKEASVNSKTLT